MAHVPHLYLPAPWDGSHLPLSDSHVHHLRRVLRLQEGDPLSYTDGAGQVGSGHLAADSLARGEESARPRPSHLAVAVGPPRSRDRVRFLVEKLAELGVARLLWVRTGRTEGRPPPASKAQAWVEGALEQSRGAWKMSIDQVALEELDRSRLVVADPDGEEAVPGGEPILLVGPEGGLEEEEIPPGVPRLSLGPTILRVETAAVVGAAMLRARPPRLR